MLGVAGHTKCKGPQEGFANDFLCGANARFSAQVCTIGHTHAGSCICSKAGVYRYPLLVQNPDCPVAGRSDAVYSVDFSPNRKRVVSDRATSS